MSAAQDIQRLRRLRQRAIKAAGKSARAKAEEGKIKAETGEELRRQRMSRMITLRALAAKLGVNPSTLTRIEHGTLPLRKDDIEIVSQVWETGLNVETTPEPEAPGEPITE